MAHPRSSAATALVSPAERSGTNENVCPEKKIFFKSRETTRGRALMVRVAARVSRLLAG